jgi:hypothetical protein
MTGEGSGEGSAQGVSNQSNAGSCNSVAQAEWESVASTAVQLCKLTGTECGIREQQTAATQESGSHDLMNVII